MSNFTEIPWTNIVKFGQETMLDTDLFSVSWILGRFCNYKCSYCWPYASTDQYDLRPLEVYTNAIDEIKRQARENGFHRFHWSFSGGEPTAYNHLLELCQHLTDTCYQSIHMTTNLSPGLRYWNHWCYTTERFQRRSLTASYHAEFADEKEFGDKILQLMRNDVFVTVNQVMVPEKFYEYYDRCKRLSERGINVTLKPQSDTTASKIVDGYTEDMILLMRVGFPQHYNEKDVLQVKLIDDEGRVSYIDQAERFNAYGFNRFSGWTCNAGYQGVIIRSDEVKRGYSCHDPVLGTLTKGFKLFDEPKRCVTASCISSADSKIPKCR